MWEKIKPHAHTIPPTSAYILERKQDRENGEKERESERERKRIRRQRES